MEPTAVPPTLAYHVGTMWRSANPAGLSGNVDATDDSRTTPARRLQHRNPKHSPVEHGAGVYGFTDRFGGATAHQSNTARFVAPAQQPQLETEQTQPGHYDDHYEAKRMADRRNRRRQPTRYSSVQAYMEWNSNETAGASTTPSPAALLFHSQPRVTGYSVRHATGQAASLIDALQGIVPDAELSQVDASASASGHGTPTRVAPTPTFRQRPPAFNSRGYSARTPVLRKPCDAQGGKSVATGPRPHAHHPRPATVGGHSQYARLVAPPRASKPSSASVRTRAILDNAKRMASATGRRNTAAAPVHYYVPAALASKKPHTPQVGAAVTPRSAAECGELDFKLKTDTLPPYRPEVLDQTLFDAVRAGKAVDTGPTASDAGPHRTGALLDVASGALSTAIAPVRFSRSQRSGVRSVELASRQRTTGAPVVTVEEELRTMDNAEASALATQQDLRDVVQWIKTVPHDQGAFQSLSLYCEVKLRQAALHAGTDLESILSTDRDIAATALSRGQPHHVLLATSLHCVLAMLVKESRSRHSVVLETVKRVLASGLYTNFDPATCSFLSAGGRALDDSTSGMEPSPRHKDFDGDDELATFLLQCFHHGQPSSHKAHAVAGGAASTAVALPSLDPSTQDGTVAPAFASPHVVAQYNHGLMAALRVARRRIISLQGSLSVRRGMILRLAAAAAVARARVQALEGAKLSQQLMEQARIDVQRKLAAARAAREERMEHGSPLKRILRSFPGQDPPAPGDDDAAGPIVRTAEAAAAPASTEDMQATVKDLAGAALVEHLTAALFEAVAKEGGHLKRQRLYNVPSKYHMEDAQPATTGGEDNAFHMRAEAAMHVVRAVGSSSAAFGQLSRHDAHVEQRAFFRLLGDWLRRDELRSGAEFKALCRHVCGCDVLAKRLSFIFHVLDLERAEVAAAAADEAAADAAAHAAAKAKRAASRRLARQLTHHVPATHGNGSGNNLDDLDAQSVSSHSTEDDDIMAPDIAKMEGILTGTAAAAEAQRQTRAMGRPSTWRMLSPGVVHRVGSELAMSRDTILRQASSARGLGAEPDGGAGTTVGSPSPSTPSSAPRRDLNDPGSIGDEDFAVQGHDALLSEVLRLASESRDLREDRTMMHRQVAILEHSVKELKAKLNDPRRFHGKLQWRPDVLALAGLNQAEADSRGAAYVQGRIMSEFLSIARERNALKLELADAKKNVERITRIATTTRPRGRAGYGSPYGGHRYSPKRRPTVDRDTQTVALEAEDVGTPAVGTPQGRLQVASTTTPTPTVVVGRVSSPLHTPSSRTSTPTPATSGKAGGGRRPSASRNGRSTSPTRRGSRKGRTSRSGSVRRSLLRGSSQSPARGAGSAATTTAPRSTSSRRSMSSRGTPSSAAATPSALTPDTSARAARRDNGLDVNEIMMSQLADEVAGGGGFRASTPGRRRRPTSGTSRGSTPSPPRPLECSGCGATLRCDACGHHPTTADVAAMEGSPAASAPSTAVGGSDSHGRAVPGLPALTADAGEGFDALREAQAAVQSADEWAAQCASRSGAEASASIPSGTGAWTEVRTQARQHLEDVVHAVASHQRAVAMAGGGDVSYNELPNTLPELEQRVEQLVFAAFDQEDRLSKKALQMCDTPDNASGGHGGSSDPTPMDDEASAAAALEQARTVGAIMGRIKQRCGADPGAIRTRLREVRNAIAQVYAAKLTADAVDDLDNCERSSMEEYLLDSFARQFGLQDLSSGNLKALTMAAAALAPISATCRVFVSIVGDSEPLFGAASGSGTTPRNAGGDGGAGGDADVEALFRASPRAQRLVRSHDLEGGRASANLAADFVLRCVSAVAEVVWRELVRSGIATEPRTRDSRSHHHHKVLSLLRAEPGAVLVSLDTARRVIARVFDSKAMRRTAIDEVKNAFQATEGSLKASRSTSTATAVVVGASDIDPSSSGTAWTAECLLEVLLTVWAQHHCSYMRHLHMVFSRCDADNNNVVSLAEFQRLMRQLDPVCSAANVERLFERYALALPEAEATRAADTIPRLTRDGFVDCLLSRRRAMLCHLHQLQAKYHASGDDHMAARAELRHPAKGYSRESLARVLRSTRRWSLSGEHS